ncbi:MAG TPA: hypothetical protein ENK23_01470 [Sorangium sp.]|nr:hypothetical protein [Sorangium sp.]
MSTNSEDTNMTTSYAPFGVRADIVAAHQRVWKHLAQAGRWLTGAQRVAIMAEARAAAGCALCSQRKAAASPYMVDGQHDGDGELHESWRDAIHRVATDPGRLSKRVFDDVCAAGGNDALYIELLAVTIFTVSIDVFCRTIGAAPLALPTPQAGTPTRERPSPLTDIGAWIDVVVVDSPLGKQLYPPLPHVANVVRALTLAPAAARYQQLLGNVQYIPEALIGSTAEGGRAISRTQMELLASRVSTLNQCFY